MTKLLTGAVILSLPLGAFNSVVLFNLNADTFGATGYTFFQMPSFLQGANFGSARQLSVSNAGVITNTAVLTQSGAATFSGDTRVKSLVQTGSKATLSTANAGTSSITAAQVCDNALLVFSTTSALFVQLPSSTLLVADCMTTVGDTRSITLHNNGSGSTTLSVAQGGAGSTTIIGDNTYATIGVSSEWVLDFIMASSSEVIVRRSTFR